jgi:hypothetical protein
MSANLIDWLRSLAPEGATGFEGLVRELLESWTGRKFRLARGGEQFGHDAKTDSDPRAPLTLIECKRYGGDNKPSSRELMGELGQALARFPDLDLWVLAATTEIGSNAVAELRSLADQHAVEILVIDTRPGGGDLEILCAQFPEVTESFAGDPGLDLATIRGRSDFAQHVESVRGNLSGLLLGFDGARRRMADWLRNHVGERASAKAAFGQDLALKAEGITLIPRPAIFARLDEWWTTNRNHTFSLVGEEGSGKSWAAMAWLLNLVARPDHPLIIPITWNRVPAVGAPSPIQLATVILARCIGPEIGRTADEWWSKRVTSWRQHLEPATPPAFLFLLDGLNESPGYDWRTLLEYAQVGNHNRLDATLLTCRLPFWKEVFGQRGALPAPYVTEGYDDAELRQAVAGRVDLSTVPAELRDLMRRPRYCDLVTTHCRAMIASGDFTVARLLFEDRLDRYRRKANHPFTPQDFDQVLARLALEHHRQWKRGRAGAGFGKKELRDALPQDDRRALQELIDGGVLDHTDDPAYPYRVEKRRLVHGLGMLLASDLRQRDNGFTDFIREWFEPQRDMDIKAEILRAAVFFSLPTDFGDYPSPQRRALLREWLLSRNMPAEQEAAITAYLPDCADDLLTEADGFFAPSDDSTGNASVRLGKALAARRTNPRVLPALQQAAERWAGYVRDAKGGSEWKPSATEFGSFEKVRFEDMRGAGLQAFMAAIIQAGPRHGFAKAYQRAALAAGFIQSCFVDDRIAWSLRLTDEDIESWVSPRWEPMAKAGGVGHVLLRDALGTRIVRNCPAYRSFEKPDFSEDRFIFGGIDNDIADLAPGPGKLGKEWDAELRTRLTDIDLSQYIPARHSTPTNHEFELLEPVAAAVAPDALGNFLRSLLESLPTRPPENLFTLCLYLPPMMMAAGPDQWAALRAVRAVVDHVDQRAARSAEAMAFLALAMVLPEEQACELFLSRSAEACDLRQLHHWLIPQSPSIARAMHTQITAETDSTRLARLLFVAAQAPVPLTDDQRKIVAQALVDDDDELLRYTATLYALKSGDAGLVTTVRCDPRRLLDEDGSLTNRLQAHILIRHGQHLSFEEVMRRLPLADLSAAVAARGNRPDELSALAFGLSAAISQIAQESEGQSERAVIKAVAEMIVIADAETIVYSQPPQARRRKGGTVEDLKEFLEAMSDHGDAGDEQQDKTFSEWQRNLFAGGHGLNRNQFSISALRAINAHSPEIVASWAQAMIVSQSLRWKASSFCQCLAAALVREAPELGFRLWEILYSDWLPVTFKVNAAGAEWMACLPFQAPDSPQALAARKHIFDQAITDQELSNVATIAVACGRRDWLVTEIERHIAMKPLWRRGKGLTLAALADLDDQTFDRLVAASDINDTWIGDALPAIQAYHDHDRWARHWYQQFLTAADRDAGYAGFVLFLKSADRRCRLWMAPMEANLAREPGFDEWRVRYRMTIEDTIAKSIEDNEKERAERLMGLGFKKEEVIPYGLWLADGIQISAPRTEE